MQSAHDASKKWNEQYEKLKAFKATHGHARVPCRYDADKSLGTWVSRQRSRKEKLRDDRRRLLNEIEFVWSKKVDHEKVWLTQYEKLKAYKETHGNTLVPPHGADKSLRYWVRNQRYNRQAGRLRDDRRRLLNEIEFVWSEKMDHEKVWLIQYEKLKAYKETHGNTLVPYSYDADRSLGAWVSNQRHLRNKDKLRPNRKELLDAIAFDWEPPTGAAAQQGKKDAQWLQQYENVKAFKHTYGHIRIPWKTHKELSQWVANQRSVFRADKLREDRRQLLETIDFPFVAPVSSAATQANTGNEISSAPVETDHISLDSVLDDAVDGESDEEELDEGSEEDKKAPPVIDLSCASRRSKRLSGQKRCISYNEDSSGEEDLDPADKKIKVEKEQVGMVKDDGDAGSHTEIAIKEEEDAPPIKHEVAGDFTGIVFKEEENEFVGPVKKEEEDEESMDVKVGAMKKEEEEGHHNAIKKEDENGAPGGPNGKRIKEENDGKIAIKHENIMKKTET